MIRKVETDMKFNERELEVLELWKRDGIFHKCMHMNEGAEAFTFYDGPPTANGVPHVGHVETRAFKDLIPRYKAMKGYYVLRKAGWDTHGLPVELEVEKELGLSGKPQIEAYGIEPFIKKCRESVWMYKEQWERMSERCGFFADMDNPYITYENSYIESVWWSLRRIWDQGLLYHGHKVVPYCPRCGTALSSHELAQGYKDVTESSLYVRFHVKGEENTYILAWTTTPWTLPSNVALCVNAEIDYVKALDSEGRVCILAKALVENVLGEGCKIVETMKGSELVGLEYEPLFPFVEPKGKRAFEVVADDYVSTSDGVGIVHIAPAFGEDDARIGREYDLAFAQLVDTQGCFVPGTGLIEGMFVKDADPKITEDLKERGLLVAEKPYEHSYPFCWRCDTPLIYYARATWFIQMTAVKEKLARFNQSVNWLPDNIKDGRMGDFIDNVVDWGLSRERYWGTPLPIWQCSCGHEHLVGSVAELYEMGIDVPENIELHKPYIDAVKLRCAKCGGEMTRVKDVIDCWYDAGSMPFAQWHYPFENKELFERHFPANYISEAVDQTRGWFYALLAISTLLFDEASFQNCIVLGHVGDKDGIKMSKHKGNGIDPMYVLDKYGADTTRWYFYVSRSPWLPIRFYEEALSEAQRKFQGTLWNTYAFFCLYASIDSFDPKAHKLEDSELSVMDKHMLSRLNTLVGTVDKCCSEYKLTEASRAIGEFVEELSNWYLRLSRERFWGKGMEGDKEAAFVSLYTALVTLAKLIAPFVPFISELMYQNLVRDCDSSAPESVHLCAYPERDEARVDEKLEAEMAKVMEVVTLGRAARATSGIKTRQPLAALYLKGVELDGDFAKLVLAELNIKKLEHVEDARAFTTYTFKPQLRTLGRKYGKLVPAIGEWLASLDGNAAMDILNAGNMLEGEIDGQKVELAMEDVLVAPAQKEGFIAQSQRDVTVVLDINLNDELIDEGFVRELVSKIQQQRKEAGLDVSDRIALSISAPEPLASVAARFADEIGASVLAVSVNAGEGGGNVKDWNINGIDTRIGITKV